MEQSLPQASSLPYLMSFYMLFLLPNVFTTSMSLRVWPRTGWYVHDRNRGLHIRFQCLEESGTKVVWMFKGQNLSASSPCIDGATRTVCGPMLHISKFQYEYAGNYTCKNPSTGREVHVPLGVQPEFVDRHQTDYIAAEGKRVDLDCSVRSNVFPNASVVWQKREGDLLRRVGTGETLTTLKAGLKDSGTYICKATNNPQQSLTTRSKHIFLTVYVPASCSFRSANIVANNVSVTVKLSGTPPPRFSATQPWHRLDNDTSDHAIATRPLGFSESSRQQIGHLTQVVISGKTTQILPQACNPYVDIPPRRFQMCLFVRFTPKEKFCASKPSFNSQATELIKQLVTDLSLYVYRDECHYVGDIRAVFVEGNSQCQPFRIVAYLQSDVNSSLHCLNASKTNSWLSFGNSLHGTVEMFRDINDQLVNVTHCSAPTSGVSIQKCHRVFYCSKSHKKDRTVCLKKGHFRKTVDQGEHNSEQSVISSKKNPRMLCGATFRVPKVTVHA